MDLDFDDGSRDASRGCGDILEEGLDGWGRARDDAGRDMEVLSMRVLGLVPMVRAMVRGRIRLVLVRWGGVPRCFFASHVFGPW